MRLLKCYLLFLVAPAIQTIRVPAVENITIVGLSSENSTVLHNKSCEECLCQMGLNASAVDCFPNKTCRIFPIAPRRYRVSSVSGAKLIFPTGVLLAKSQCRMPNTTELVMKLQHGTRQQVNITTPRCLLLAENGLLVTPDFGSKFLRGYDLKNLTQVMELPINISNPYTLGKHAGAYYLGLQNSSILVINVTDLRIINIISSPSLNGVRDMMFLNGGETLVAVSTGSNRFSFFKQISGSAHNYTFFYNQPVNYTKPHGLLHVNDTFFYATSWMNNTINSYEKMNETWWRETLFIDARPWTNTSGGNHVTVDECDRFWFALGSAGILIYSQSGTYEERFLPNGTADVFDTIIADDYLVFISDIVSKNLVPIDPNIQC